MRCHVLVLVGSALLLAMGPVAAAAQTPEPVQVPLRIDLGGFFGVTAFGSGTGLGNAGNEKQIPGTAPEIGLHGGVVLLDGRLGLEAEFRDAFVTLGGSAGNAQVLGLRGQALWYVLNDGPVQPFVLVGGGEEILVASRPSCPKLPAPATPNCIYVKSPDSDDAGFVGLGARFPLTHRLAVRLGGRYLLADGRPLTKAQVAAKESQKLSHNFEATLGAVFTLGGKPADGDLDGVADDSDKCLDRAEDRDGFQDADGCPDDDNDNDGVADDKDACINQPEDTDQFDDADGCPDLDNDGDGVPDAKDKCPNVPEDRDGTADDDGCPDVDDDGDGLENDKDKCPKEKEDKDGFQDDDGCPDPDNDGDGIPDAADKCPDQAETKNGLDDTDGCPDQLGEAVGKLFGGPVAGIEFKAAQLAKTADPILEPLLELLLENDNLRVEVGVRAEAEAEPSRKLAEQRAKALAGWLTERGIDSGRLQTVVLPAAAGAKAPPPAKPARPEVLLRIL